MNHFFKYPFLFLLSLVFFNIQCSKDMTEDTLNALTNDEKETMTEQTAQSTLRTAARSDSFYVLESASIPAAITNYITANYSTATILKVAQKYSGEYFAVIKQDTTIYVLRFDANANFVSVEAKTSCNFDSLNHAGKRGHGGRGGHKGLGAFHDSLHRPHLKLIDVSTLPTVITDYIAAHYNATTLKANTVTIDKAGLDSLNNYHVLISIDGVRTMLKFDSNGNFVEEVKIEGRPAQCKNRGTEITQSNMPSAALTYIATNYAQATIHKYIKGQDGNYAVVLLDNGVKKIVIFDANGNYLSVKTK